MKKFLFVLGLLCLVMTLFLSWFVPRAWLWTGKANVETQKYYDTVKVTIGDGWDAARTSEALVRADVIDSALGYQVYVWFDGTIGRAMPGEYQLRTHWNYRAIAQALAMGPPRGEVKLTVVEGWSLESISTLLASYQVTMPTTIPNELRQTYPFLADLPKTASLEGYLFPDTYRVYADQLPQGLIKKQLDEFAERAPALADEAKRQGRTLRDVVILASIVEKEVAKPQDRAIVAGIFLNRLAIGMPLQSDATVNYVTHGGRARPTLNDLQADSAYNTYLHKGLPPGPISNPGDAALNAVLHPTPSEYTYFLTDDLGKTYFAKTFEEHQRNRVKAYGR